MSALRERNTRSLAPGNQFELSPHNETLNPDRGWQVVTEPSDALREFVAGVQDHYVAEGWDFKDALTSPHHNRSEIGCTLILPLRILLNQKLWKKQKRSWLLTG